MKRAQQTEPSAWPLYALCSAVRTERGLAFEVSGVSRGGIPRPAWLTIEEYAAIAARLEAELSPTANGPRTLCVIINSVQEVRSWAA